MRKQPLRSALSSPDEKGRYVRRLFATIANRYDLITVVLSYGQDRRWKRRLAELADVRKGEHALDLACGTGDIAFEVAARGAAVIGADITLRMIELARRKSADVTTHRRPVFVVGDMMALPFPDAAFELVTAGYGIRNVPRIEPALAEIARVLKPGGRLLSLDFNRPANPFLRWIYLAYLTVVGSALGMVLHRDPDTYRYIPESIKRYPGAAGVSARLRAAGFALAWHVNVLGGLMAINVAVKN